MSIIKMKVTNFIAYVILTILLFMSYKAFSLDLTQFHVMELDNFSMMYRQHVNYRDAYFPAYETIDRECTKSEECMKFGANALFDLTIISYKRYGLFWRNDIIMDATNRQVRHVAWDWQIGMPITKYFEIYHHHTSRHILEEERPTTQRFPLRDEYVLKMKFYERYKK